jgi:fructokinase
MSQLYGAVEAGGTKFVCAVGKHPTELREIRRISTSSNPLETTAEVVAYFEKCGPVRSIGIASFGPLDFDAGTIAKTPKPGWADFPIRGALERAFRVPVGFDTDVNGAALAEARYGAGAGCADFVYITVGTGIGGGAVVNGKPVHGLQHPEMGHVLLQPHPEEPLGFAGVCPFHGACLEGLASGPAMQARWGKPAAELAPDHIAWRIEAHYLAQACVDLACILSPRVIVFGGGVMSQPHLLPMIREEVARLMNGYVALPRIEAPGLPYPGLSGALALAMEAAR